MGLRKTLYRAAEYEYLFLVSFILLVLSTIGLFVAFFPASIVRSEPNFTLVFAVMGLQVFAAITGYFGAYHNVSNPYAGGSIPLWPIVGLIAFALYAGTTGALLIGRIPMGYADGILILVMTYGFGRFGWWTYKRHWRTFEMSDEHMNTDGDDTD